MNGLAHECKLVKGKNFGQDESVPTMLSKQNDEWNPECLSLVVLIIQGQRCLVWDDLCFPFAYTNLHCWPNAFACERKYTHFSGCCQQHISVALHHMLHRGDNPKSAGPSCCAWMNKHVAETQEAWHHTLHLTWAVTTCSSGGCPGAVWPYGARSSDFSRKSTYLDFYVTCSNFKNTCCVSDL